ncbi:MAG TPA: DUF2244 domain-containing protein, partial [Methylophilaceae bacterium]|nr:DUF2244 domain-containing protein [Methylophilaceae bacterium]
MLSIVDCKVVARPNASLSPDGSLKLLIVLAIVMLVVSIGFIHIGAWLVMPFAGLELLAFATAFYHVNLHAADYESITIEEDRVIVEKRGYRNESSTVFQRYWTQVSLRESFGGRSALYIGSHGKEVEFGKHLIDDEQRIVIMREL